MRDEMTMTPAVPKPRLPAPARLGGFSLPDLPVVVSVLSVLATIVVPLLARNRAQSRLAQCMGNLQQVNRAVLLYANDAQGRLPSLQNSPAPGAWWFYKEQVKGYLGLSGPSSPQDKVFGFPDDRGYGDGAEMSQPFR